LTTNNDLAWNIYNELLNEGFLLEDDDTPDNASTAVQLIEAQLPKDTKP